MREQGTVPPDDLTRMLVVARPSEDSGLEHIGIVGDTYTLLLTGEQTTGKFCLIDMHIPPGGGPPPHRHDFEETFMLLEGEVEATFRGRKLTVKAGETIHIPANAPHQFHNSSDQDVRLLCLCAPAGQEEMFRELGSELRRGPRHQRGSMRLLRQRFEKGARSWRRSTGRSC